MSATVVGKVSAIRRYPVKSMLGEQLRATTIAEGGVAGDRAYALVDDDTGKVVSVKRPRRWGRMFELAAATHAGDVQVRFPDGTSVMVDDPALPARLSVFLGRKVSIASGPAADATFDETWVRHLKDGANPYFDTASRTEDGEELIDAGTFMGPQGNFFNVGAIHIVTTSTTRRLAELAPQNRFDAHRFRPNIVIETDESGFVETGWQGRTLSIGGVRLSVTFTVPRCVMTTLAQGELPADQDVLRTITRHNAIDVFATGTRYPCVGVYAIVNTAGDIRTGDTVTIH